MVYNNNVSVEELNAAFEILRERTNQITMASEVIRDLIAGRSLRDEEKHSAFGDFGQQMFDEALAEAPAKATELRETEQQRQGAVTYLVTEGVANIFVSEMVINDIETNKPLVTPIHGFIPEGDQQEAAERLLELSDLSDPVNNRQIRTVMEPFVRYYKPTGG